jgi:hypothetical protein
MVPYHCSPDRALELRTKITANGFAWPIPFLGIVLTTVGFLLFMTGVAGLMEMPAPTTSMRPSWLHSQDGGDLATMTRSPTGPRRAGSHPRVMAWSAQENAGFGNRWVSRATSRSWTRVDRIASARVAADPTVRTGSAHVGMPPVSSGSGMISVDLLQPIRLGRNSKKTPVDAGQEGSFPLYRDAREAPPTMVAMQHTGRPTR